MLDLAQAYSETHQHLAQLALACTRDELARTVPASPDWSVKDVVGHVAGVAAEPPADGCPRIWISFGRSPNPTTLRGGRR